ncbi:hypothetical protein [Crocosphaera sp. Alani8]|uniref:hypothetical protein n=1 Tax=Crocosphaera sp. Alani8 TaxID=3038952 RepID=UPI00313B362E
MHQCNDKNLNQIKLLLTRYGFEVKQVPLSELIEEWVASYSPYWIRLAIVEAIYQGRYKAISVDHILALWKRLGHPTYHFTYEFERFISRNVFIEDVISRKTTEEPPQEKPSTPEQPSPSIHQSIITLTPIQELVKKIPVPISFPSEILTSKTNSKTLLKNTNLQELPKEKLVIDQQQSYNQSSKEKEKKNCPINRFIPLYDTSEFYGKLKAVAYQQLSENQDN